MTQKELQQAYSNEFLEETMNYRKFEQDTSDWTNRMKVTLEGGRYHVAISTYEEDWGEYLTADELLAKINNEGWEMQDLDEEQKFDLEMEAMPEVDPITETTYTTKSGYVMHMFRLSYYTEKSKWYEVEKALKQMRGWIDRKNGGYMLRTRQDAERLMNIIDAR